MELQTATDGLIYAGYLAAALAAIGVVLRFAVVRPMKKWLREQIKPELSAVHAQVTPGGASLSDAVSRIERRQDEHGEQLHDHIVHHPGAVL